jgi:hypothetical protein
MAGNTRVGDIERLNDDDDDDETSRLRHVHRRRGSTRMHMSK